MLTTDRDCRRGGQRFAMPTLGEVEGKLIASEIVATSCLRQLLVGSNTDAMLSIRLRIRQALNARCRIAGLCCEDTDAAVEYALQFLDATVEAVRSQPKPSLKSGGCVTVRRLRRMGLSEQ